MAGEQNATPQTPDASTMTVPAAPPPIPSLPDTTQPNPSTAAPPTVVTPVRRGGLAGIVDELRDAIAGPNPAQVYTDADGNKYVQHPESTSRQKWMRIASTAVRGAASGLGAGKGRNPGAAAAAGGEVGNRVREEQREQNKDVSEEVRQANLERYNSIKIKHEQAQWGFELRRQQVQATQEDVKFAQQQIDRERSLNSADLGTFKDLADLTNVKQKDPDFWKHYYANQVVAIPEVAPDGQRLGLHVFLRTPGIGNQQVPPGTKVLDFVPGKLPTDPPKLVERELSDPATISQVDDWTNSARNKMDAWQSAKAERDLKIQEAATGKANQAKAEAETKEIKTKNAIEQENLRLLKQTNTPVAENFTPDPGAIVKSEAELRQSLGAQGQVLPADFSTLYAIGHYDADLTHNYSPRPYNRPGSPVQKSSAQATAFIRTFINPEFDEKNYKAVQQMQEEYASTKQNTAGGNAIAFNTATRHLGMAYDAAVALQNGKMPAVNAVALWFSKQTGHNVQPNFDSIKAALLGELGKTFKGTAADIPERQDLEKTIESSGSPDQLLHSGVLQTYARLMQSKVDVLDNHYHALTGRHATGLIDPETAAVYQKLGIGQGAGQQRPADMPAKVPTGYIHIKGPKGMGWYPPGTPPVP